MADLNEVANMMSNEAEVASDVTSSVADAAQNGTEIHMVSDGFTKKGVLVVLGTALAAGVATAAVLFAGDKLTDKIDEFKEKRAQKKAERKAKKEANKASENKTEGTEFKGEKPNKEVDKEEG